MPKNLHNNTPGSKKTGQTSELTTGYRNMFFGFFPAAGWEGGGRTTASRQHRLFGHSLRKIWESPSSSSSSPSSSSFVFLIQATPICLLRMVSGSHRGQHQSSLRQNRGEDCMKNPVIWSIEDHRLTRRTPDFLFVIMLGSRLNKKKKVLWTLEQYYQANPPPKHHRPAQSLNTRPGLSNPNTPP